MLVLGFRLLSYYYCDCYVGYKAKIKKKKKLTILVLC